MHPIEQRLREEIFQKVSELYHFKASREQYVPGESVVPCAGRVYDEEEIIALVDASLDFWLTTGRYAAQFEREFARFLGVRHAILCNSGSSANLLAVSALTSPKLGNRRLKPGDEVITVAAGFPTTVNAILQNGLVPVFVDIEIGTYNVNVHYLEEAFSQKTGAVMLAHTLGNPFDLDAICTFVKKYDLWLIEDNCDALGSTYKGQLTGSFGDLASVSFYPAHQITMGEGGCVLTNHPRLKTLVESFRDWGRDCWCNPGKENTCGKRFSWQLGKMHAGYDHKYLYSHIGYNLKLTDMQAAIGTAQLKKLPTFITRRKQNWRQLREGMDSLKEWLILPEATPNSDPCWFGFLVTVRPGAPFTRRNLVAHLEQHRVATRMLFGGNLTRQPAYQGRNFRVVGNMEQTDLVMNNAFWIGVYPGLTDMMIEYVLEQFHEFFSFYSVPIK